MTEGSAASRLAEIEAELTSIFAGGLSDAPEVSVSLALLARQSELLQERAQVQLELGEPDAAVTSATDAAAIANTLIPRVRDEELESRLLLVARRAIAVRAIGNLRTGNLVEARKLLSQLRSGDDDSDEADYVDRELLEEQATREQKIAELNRGRREEENRLELNWSEAEAELNVIARVIAEHVVEAGSLMKRVPHPDLFLSWFQERIDANIRFVRAKAPQSADDEQEEVDHAKARGIAFQRRVFESGELLSASSLHIGGKAATDDVLKHFRDGGMLLALEDPESSGVFGYPIWQFEPNHAQLIGRTCMLLSAVDPWGRWKFFHTASPVLRNLTPLQALGFQAGSASTRKEADGARAALPKGEKLEALVLAAASDFLYGAE